MSGLLEWWLIYTAISIFIGGFLWFLIDYSGDEEDVVTRRWVARFTLSAPLWPIWLAFGIGYGLHLLLRGLLRDAARPRR